LKFAFIIFPLLLRLYFLILYVWSKLIIKLFFKSALNSLIFSTNLKSLIKFLYFNNLELYSILVSKLDSIETPEEKFAFKSPSLILMGPTSLKIFLSKTSDLSAKKLKLVLTKGIFLIISPFKFETEPLAICDGRTIPEKGFITIERRYPHRTAEVFHISYNPEHKWIYFPQMTPDEALIFKVFDTDAGAGVKYTAHSAFEDPNSPPTAKPRESIEIRALALF